jgi:hypothetical protein
LDKKTFTLTEPSVCCMPLLLDSKAQVLFTFIKLPGNYNREVARGWESKSVEEQQAEAREKKAHKGTPLSAAEAARQREKENLHLSRQQVLQQMKNTQNPRHRELLQDALAALDEKLSQLKA